MGLRAVLHADEIVESLPRGAVLLLPNDAANQGQALWLLQREGLLELDPAVEPRTAKIRDWQSPGFTLKEADLLAMPRMLDWVDVAIGYVSQFDAGKDRPRQGHPVPGGTQDVRLPPWPSAPSSRTAPRARN